MATMEPTTVAIDDDDDEERAPLNSAPLDERILDVVRNAKHRDDTKEGGGGHGPRRITVRPALLASELGLGVEDATRELCGLLSAVGGGETGASFVFERVEMPRGGEEDDDGAAASSLGSTKASATTMVFTFPEDFDVRARRHRRRSEWRERLRALSAGMVKGIKIFTAFGLVISLAVLIVAGICLLVAAAIALARGGQGGGGGGGHRPMMHRLRYLFFQLRQILWLYAICGSAVDGQQDPFMREVAGDLAFMLSMFCGNPMHPFFWFRIGGMRRRWARVRRSRGWGGTSSWNNWSDDGNNNGVAMVRRGTWGDDGTGSRRNHGFTSLSSFNSSSDQQQRGLLSIAVEFLFGPSETSGGNSDLPPPKELEKWKFRAAVILTLSSSSPGNGISLRDLLPYADNPPSSADDPSALRETLRIVTHFNGKPVVCSDEANSGQSSGMDARFCFPEIVAEMDYEKVLTLGNSDFAPPAFNGDSRTNITSILYKEEEDQDFGSSANASSEMPEYLYERPYVLTELSRQEFGQCAMLGLLNFVGIIWVQNAMKPGGLLELPVAAATGRRSRRSGSGSLIALASLLLMKLFSILRFYAGLFFILPLSRLMIVLIRNYGVQKRNRRRLNFVRVEM